MKCHETGVKCHKWGAEQSEMPCSWSDVAQNITNGMKHTRKGKWSKTLKTGGKMQQMAQNVTEHG